jgi:hypothetical protein
MRTRRSAKMPYRQAPPRPEDPYLVAWAQLRRRRTRAWAITAGYVAFAMTTACLYERLSGHRIGRAPFSVLTFPVLAIFFALRKRAHDFRCPRCGERFEAQRGVRNPTTRRCLNCGIAMGTPKDAMNA